MTAPIRHLRSLVLVLTFSAAPFALLAGCGDDDDDGETACERAAHVICERGCACREGEGCGVTDSSGEATTTIGFDNLEDCETLFLTLGCAGDDGSIDFEACASDLPDAECSGTDDRGGVTLPASCE